MKSKHALAILVWMLAAVGCAIQSGEEGAGSGSGGATSRVVSETQEELTTCNPTTNCGHANILEFDSPTNGGYAGSVNANDYICWASRVPSQDSPLDGPNVRVGTVSAFGQYFWRLWGKGKMSCVKRCCFSSNGGSNDVNWLSGNFTVSGYSSCSPPYEQAWWGDAATLIQGAKYATMGSSDQTYEIFRGKNIATDVGVVGCGDTHANSLFVGIPGGNHNRKVTGNYIVHHATHIRTMIPVNDGICYFRGLSGYIDRTPGSDPAGERSVKIEPEWYSAEGIYRWTLRNFVPSGGSLWPNATAICYYYNQNQP